MTAYYNEIDPYAAQWLRNLIKAGHIAPGVVDERSIEDVTPDELRQYTQCHFFAGIGVWSMALRRAGWPDDRAVWTGSCPCQPFSAAGAGAGFADERHLWPSFAWLLAQCAPPVIFGEQVASKAVEPWVDLVHTDMEALGYAFGAIPFPSAGVGAPHIRDRLYWVAHAHGELSGQGSQDYRGRNSGSYAQAWAGLGCGGVLDGLGQPYDGRLESEGLPTQWRNGCDQLGSAGDGEALRRESWAAGGFGTGATFAASPGPVNGFWRAADWIGCRDDKWRPVEPGTFPLAHGAASRVGRLRAYGNAINAEAATQFIASYLEIPHVIYATPYNPATLRCTGPSTDSGFSSLDEVPMLLGEPAATHRHMVTYPDSGVAYTDFPLNIDTPVTAPVNSVHIPTGVT